MKPLFLLFLAIALTSCARVPIQGEIRHRHREDSLYVMEVIGPWGDTTDVATSREVYDVYPDMYFTVDADRDSVMRHRPEPKP